MRLIDADALKLSHCKECTLYPDRCLGDECDWDSIAHIDMMPTVEAIPVEFIESTMNRWKEIIGYEESVEALRILIDNWKIERKEE